MSHSLVRDCVRMVCDDDDRGDLAKLNRVIAGLHERIGVEHDKTWGFCYIFAVTVACAVKFPGDDGALTPNRARSIRNQTAQLDAKAIKALDTVLLPREETDRIWPVWTHVRDLCRCAADARAGMSERDADQMRALARCVGDVLTPAFADRRDLLVDTMEQLRTELDAHWGTWLRCTVIVSRVRVIGDGLVHGVHQAQVIRWLHEDLLALDFDALDALNHALFSTDVSNQSGAWQAWVDIYFLCRTAARARQALHAETPQ